MSPVREHVFSLPNALTLARVPLAGLVWAAPYSRSWLLAMVALAAVTDVLDGRIARWIRARRLARGDDPGRIGEAHTIGAWLDPMCDKLFVLSVVAAIGVAYRARLHELLLVATREIILVPLVLAYALAPRARRRLRLDFRAGPAGKATTVAQFGAVAAIVVWPRAASALAATAAIIGLVAAALYLSRAIALARYAAQNPFTYERWLEVNAELRAPRSRP